MRTSRLYVQSVHVDVPEETDYALVKASPHKPVHQSFRLRALYLPIHRAGMHRTRLYKLLRVVWVFKYTNHYTESVLKRTLCTRFHRS
jgi:hypothetical protein